MKNKKITVTVGVSAFNEAGNIKNLLKSLLSQDTANFKFEKIILILDGSTDNTVRVAKSVHNKKIGVIDSKKRLGLSARLNQIIKLNKSDILVKIDADSILKNHKVLENIVSKFGGNIYLVGGHVEPIPGKTLLEKIHVLSDQMWHYAKKNINNGNNIHNNHGQLFAMRKSLADKTRSKTSLLAYEDFFYLTNVKLKGDFNFAPNAICMYKTPDNFYDYLNQARRFVSIKRHMNKHFGDWVEKEYFVPKIVLYKVYIKSMVKSPILFLSYVLIEIIIRLSLKYKEYRSVEAVWRIAESTKIMTSKLVYESHKSQ